MSQLAVRENHYAITAKGVFATMAAIIPMVKIRENQVE